ncbi:putative bifunctional diguanylate cyclase/phosphodiesterase [Asticcacaulis taihuensis]|uniref:putative bifunctional diguanylate cyclase/phosphodiesterase n=1 Tax=Asticcacaulis taihuensis TaxID=260084 RepID=UPI0026EBD022|nr:EAL domain-containing protein [Asticcacaulis taihuensis]
MFFQRVANVFRVPTGNAELSRAQYDAFAKQIPLLYLLLTTNTIAVATSYVNVAPFWLTVGLPAVLCLMCILRLVKWLNRSRKMPTDEMVLKQLRQTNRLAIVIAAAFTAWGLILYGYGDAYAHGHVAFYMAVTVIGCIFCLMHMRSAAIIVTLIVNIPFIIFFLLQPQTSLKAMALNLVFVSAAMIIVLLVYSRDFARLVESRSETRRLGDENFRIANLDALTGLANRRWFFAELTKQHERAQTTGAAFAIGIIDLDGFKPVNDTYGHMTGDRVLTEAAQRLKEACGDDIILARLGGDEFGFIVSGNPTRDELRWLGAAISDIIRLPYAVGSSQALLGSSIGVAGYPQSANDPQALFERADYALYHAKRHQRGQMVIFSTEHEEQIRSHSVIEQALQNADLDAELSMVFQPIVDITTGQVRAFEALARWQSPTLGNVSPDRFIPVAERAGHVRGVTKTLLKKALAALAQWPADIRMSFNLSAHDLSDSETVVQIIAIINRSRVDPKRIDFEITETAVAHDFKQAVAAVQTLKALGAGISLDDFGTGYSSLSHVHRLPLDKIKVDRSFITDIGSNPVSLKIVKSLTALCADMGLDCIIEGVETAAQLATLRDLGCRMVQGYYFAQPMTEAEVPAFLASADEKRA